MRDGQRIHLGQEGHEHGSLKKIEIEEWSIDTT